MKNTHLLIPDTQVAEGVPLQHLEALGNYIVEKRPNTIIHIGDHWDMNSLSSYDKGKMKAEGKRVNKDIDVGIKAMEILLKPLNDLQKRQRKNKKKVYSPRMEFTLGNHEERIMRHVNSNPELEGYLNYDALCLEEMGWNVNPFLVPVIIDGVSYAHYFYNPLSGRPYGGTINNKLNKIHDSFTMGHVQGLQMATETTNNGRKIWGLVAGSFYMHDEDYKGPQANDHWRGIVMKHNVKDGDYSPCVVNLDYLLGKYL